jgi:hypothetical protein
LKTKKAYGSITNFVVKERLAWTPRDPDQPVSAHSFTHHSSVPGIKHIVVWSRTPIAVDDTRGDVTSESKRVIEEFVESRFVRALAAEEGISVVEARSRVMWFKNWVSLQSVRGVDHVHVLVKDAPRSLLQHRFDRHDNRP